MKPAGSEPSTDRPAARHLRRGTIAALLAVLALILPTGASAAVYWGNNPQACGPPVGCFTYGAIGRANLNGTVADQFFIGPINGFAAGYAFGVAVNSAHVYWTNSRGAIGRANLNGTGADPSFISGASLPFGVAVNSAHVYWTNSSGTIGRANLDGTGVDQSFITGASTPHEVAVDGSHVYWANQGNDTIGRANLNGTGVNQSFIGGASNPFGVAVDASHVYWTNVTNGSTIGRAKLDGSSPDQSFITGVHNPFGVAVNSSHVYWANGNAIGRAKLDGSSPDQLFITGASSPFGVALDSVTLHFRPDALIKRGADASFIGDGIHNATARGQTKRSRARRGHTRVFGLRLQNDGDAIDALQVKGCRSSRGFRVTYRQGSADVTSRVISGRYATATLDPGDASALTLRVKVKGNAADGAVKPCRVSATSRADRTRKDAVEGKVKVR